MKETQRDFGLVALECGGCAPPVYVEMDPTHRKAEAPLAVLPDDPKARKALPIYSGVLAYFPDVMVALARVSKIGNDQHNPGKPLHWDRTKSQDHRDCILRHLLAGYTLDSDGVPEPVRVVWRAAADCQVYLERSPWK